MIRGSYDGPSTRPPPRARTTGRCRGARCTCSRDTARRMRPNPSTRCGSGDPETAIRDFYDYNTYDYSTFGHLNADGLSSSIASTHLASANGRPPMTNGIHFKPSDTDALYVATTFGSLVSPDGCRFYWLCEDNIGFGGGFDPAYAVTSTGAILATTFHGVRVSRDGGCSFATVTSIAGASGSSLSIYLDAIDIGPTGEICVGSADTSPDNGVFCSTDDAVTFAARGGLPPTMWYRSVKFAAGDANRLSASAYLTGGPDPDGGQRSPTAHVFRSDNDGMRWAEEPLANLVYGPSPQLDIMAVSPIDENVVFLRSQGANPPLGDRLYRSTDGGVTFTEVLVTIDPIFDVVVHDATAVDVATALPGRTASSMVRVSMRARTAIAPAAATLATRRLRCS